jgi:hypothetical protein
LLGSGRGVGEEGLGRSAVRLGELLAAARGTGAGGLDAGREEAALAAFRAARAEERAGRWLAPGRWWRTRAAAAALASVLALGAVTVAVAGAGRLLAPPAGSANRGPAVAASPRSGVSGVPATRGPGPTATPTPTAPEGPSHSRAWCRDHLSDRARPHAPTGPPDLTSYCRRLLKQPRPQPQPSANQSKRDAKPSAHRPASTSRPRRQPHPHPTR